MHKVATAVDWRNVQFNPQDQFLQEKNAEQLRLLFERLLRKHKLSSQETVSLSLPSHKQTGSLSPPLPSTQQTNPLPSTQQTSSFFPLVETRSDLEISIGQQSSHAAGSKQFHKGGARQQFEGCDFSATELQSDLLHADAGYFRFSARDSSYHLDERKYRASNSLLDDCDSFLERASELRDIHSRLLAPHWNKRVEQRYGDWAKEPRDAGAAITAGRGWFNVPGADMTPELKQELMALRLKHTTAGEKGGNVSQSAEEEEPKFVQLGRVIDGPHEFFSSRVPNKSRKRTFLDDIIHQQQDSNYVNKRYSEVQRSLDSVQKKKKRKMQKK